MHILLVKVQHKILDEKVDNLIFHLNEGLESTHRQLANNYEGTAAAQHLCSAIGGLLGVLALQKDFQGCFRHFPREAKDLALGKELPADEHHHLYELLKATLLNEKNHISSPEHTLAVFAKHFALKRPFFEPYFQLWLKVAESKLSPSARVLERLAYGTLNLVEMMVDQGLLHDAVYRASEMDTELLLRYNQNRVMSIDEALMEGNFDVDNTKLDLTNKRIPCIKCGSYAPLHGYEEIEPGSKHYIAYGFNCNHCGMELFDQKDLLLAGIKPIYEIS